MKLALYISALLLVAVGFAHSYLGERYLLRRLFRRDNLPELFGGTEFTTRTLRFAWHVTTVAWLGFAAVLVLLADPPASSGAIGLVIGLTFLIHGAVALFGSRGRHLSWLVFLAVGGLVILATHFAR